MISAKEAKRLANLANNHLTQTIYSLIWKITAEVEKKIKKASEQGVFHVVHQVQIENDEHLIDFLNSEFRTLEKIYGYKVESYYIPDGSTATFVVVLYW